MKKINIVLVNPEIPQNTGNISRTCAVTDTALHIIKPIGFEISDRTLKRAGLDYWDKLDVTYYESYKDFIDKHKDSPMLFFTAKGRAWHTSVDYPEGVFLVFGKESCGLPQSIVDDNYERTVRIPMRDGVRCLNLSNSVAIAVYEALSRTGFEGFK